MAPPQTPKNKKQTQNASTPQITEDMGPASSAEDMPPPLISQPLESYEKAQEDEREVLKAVFMDEYEESEAKGAWSVRPRLPFVELQYWNPFQVAL